MSKLKLAVNVIAVVGVTITFLIQHQAQVKLRADNESLRQQITKLQTDKESLSNRLVAIGDSQKLTSDQFIELLKLRGEVGVLRQQIVASKDSLNGKPQVNRGSLNTLYQQFLAGTSANGFVTFEREISPTRIEPPLQTSMRTNNPSKQYCAFCWEGTNFIIAFSTERPLTNENDLASASRLYGYDGQSYWELSYNSVRTYLPGDRLATSPPIDISSVVMVIPAGETTNIISESQRFAQTNINLIVEEFRRVVQLGFSYPMLGNPGILDSNRIVVNSVGGLAQTVRLEGSQNSPDILTYEPTTNHMPIYRVSLDYPMDTLTIDRLSLRGNTAGPTIRYKMLSVRKPNLPRPNSTFSLQTYMPTTEKVK